MKSIDINCDMGESFGPWVMGNDLAVMKHITSANIACGFHAGDPDTMFNTVRAAVAAGVAVGAHPGLPDLQGFGRRHMDVSPAEIYALVVYQIGALWGVARASGTRLRHVKTHGALYHMTTKDAAVAQAVVQAAHDVDPELLLYVSTASMIQAAQKAGMRMVHEVYADRSYQDDGTLTPRSQAHAMIEDVDQSIAQVKRMVLQGMVRSLSGKDVPIGADTLCVHGDQPGAVVFAQRIRAALEAEGIAVRAV